MRTEVHIMELSCLWFSFPWCSNAEGKTEKLQLIYINPLTTPSFLQRGVVGRGIKMGVHGI